MSLPDDPATIGEVYALAVQAIATVEVVAAERDEAMAAFSQCIGSLRIAVATIEALTHQVDALNAENADLTARLLGTP